MSQLLEDQIREWFSSNPNASAQDIFDVMQANNVSPEAVISAMGFDPESAMETYNTLLQAPAEPVSVAPQAASGQTNSSGQDM